MSSSHVDRNLLFGILALQMDFISRDALIAAMHAWVLNKQKPLDQILLEQGALAPDAQAVLDALVKKHLELHHGDPQQSLAAVGLPGAMQRVLAQFADPDVKASLVRLAAIAPAKPSQQTTLPMVTPASWNARFEILRSHAWGGLGEVYVAQDREVNREVALKRLHERYADDADSRSRFLREAEITGGLEHPGIVPVYGLGTSEDGRPHYAMRFIRGETLKDAIERFHSEDARTESERRIELRQLLARFIAVCNAVEYAHSRGVIHRDLKPSNIMLGKYGETLVVDWGLCKALGYREPEAAADEHTLIPSSGSGSSETLPGSAIGTPAYMSPEQSEGRIDDMGPASDVYSLGATLYTILTGKEPFESTVVGVILGKVQTGDFAPPRERNPSVPRALNAICLKAMSLLPKDRYPSCAALASDIEHWLADEPVTALRDPLSDRTIRWIKQHRVLAASSAALLATAFVGLVIGTSLLSRANSRIAAGAIRAKNAEASALKESKRAKSNEVAAAVANEQTQDALTTSLYEQARAVRLAGLPGRRWRALELLREAEKLRSRARSNLPNLPAGTEESTARREVLSRSQLRNEAVTALLLRDAHVVHEWRGLSQCVSPDGSFAASVWSDLETDHSGLVVTDLKTGKDIFKWEDKDGKMQFGVLATALSPKAEYFATVSFSSSTIDVWDLPRRKRLRELSLPKRKPPLATTHDAKAGASKLRVGSFREEISRLLFSPSGRYISAVSNLGTDSRVVMWDLQGDAAGCEVGITKYSRFPNIAFNPDSGLLAFVTAGRKVVLWNVARHQLDKEIELPPALAASGSLGFGPEGTLGIACTQSNQELGSERVRSSRILIWDVAQNCEIKRISALPKVWIDRISFSPDGARVAVGDHLAGDNILVLDVADAKPAIPVKHQQLLDLLAWTDDSRKLLSGGSGSLKMWEFSDELAISDLRMESQSRIGFKGAFAFSANGHLIAAKSYGLPDIQLFDRTTRKLVRLLPCDPAAMQTASRFLFSPDGKQFVLLAPQHLLVWDVETGTQRLRIDANRSRKQMFASAVFRADGSMLVGESDDFTPDVFEAGNRKVIRRGTQRSGVSALVSPDGKFATAFVSWLAREQPPIPVVDLANGHELFQILGPPTKKMHATLREFSPDSHWLLALHVFGGQAAGLYAVMSSFGRLGSGSREEEPWMADVWDVRSAKRHMQIEGSSNPVAYTFSHDGRYLVVGMANGTIRVWDIPGREELFDWRPFGDQSDGRFSAQYLAFTADHASLVVPSPSSPAFRLLDLLRINEELRPAALNW